MNNREIMDDVYESFEAGPSYDEMENEARRLGTGTYEEWITQGLEKGEITYEEWLAIAKEHDFLALSGASDRRKS